MQIPAGHVPVCIAPLYVIAQVLQASAPATGTAAVDLREIGVHGLGLITVPHRGRGQSYSLVFEGVEATRVGIELRLQARETPRPKPRALPVRLIPPPRIPGGARTGKAQEPEGGADGDAPPAPSGPLRTPARLAITLVPPYRECLQPDRLGVSAQALGFVGLARPLPEGVRITVPPIAERIGIEAREALCEGITRTILVDERTGESIDIPPAFWRTDEAEVALAADEIITVPIPGVGDARGRACIAPHQLDLVCSRARAKLFGKAPPPRLRTPGAALLERVSHELGYVDGKPRRWHLRLDHIAAWVELRWNEDDIGQMRNGMPTAIARLISLQEFLKPGNASTERTAQIEDWKRAYAEAAGKEYEPVSDR